MCGKGTRQTVRADDRHVVSWDFAIVDAVYTRVCVFTSFVEVQSSCQQPL